MQKGDIMRIIVAHPALVDDNHNSLQGSLATVSWYKPNLPYPVALEVEGVNANLVALESEVEVARPRVGERIRVTQKTLVDDKSFVGREGTVIAAERRRSPLFGRFDLAVVLDGDKEDTLWDYSEVEVLPVQNVVVAHPSTPPAEFVPEVPHYDGLEVLKQYAQRLGLELDTLNPAGFAVRAQNALVYSVLPDVREGFETWNFRPRLEGGRGTVNRRNLESVKRSLRRIAARMQPQQEVAF